MDKSWIKPGIWGVVIGAGAVAAVGFMSMGWVGPGTAEKMAKTRADTAVVAALVPVCLARSNADTMKMTELAAIKSPYDRRDFVINAGWTTMEKEASANGAVAEACATALSKATAS